MTKNEYLAKIYGFQDELDNCNSKESFKEIEERLQRRLRDVFLDDDPFITRCKGSWGSSPKAIASLQNAVGGGYAYVSEYEEALFHKQQLAKNIDKFKILVSKITSTVEKDGLPLNTRSSMIITVNDSPGANIAAGINGHSTQSSSVSISDFDKHYAPAIKEIDETNNLTADQREELLDMLALFKESVDNDETPKKTILKALGNYSLLTTSIGANMVTLWGFIEPYINQLPK